MHGIFDSHAHYDDDAFDVDRTEVLGMMPESGVCGVVNAASNLDSAKMGIALAERFSFVYAAVGIHPHDAAKAPMNAIEQIRQLSAHKKVVAIGEIGLDYHYDFSPRDVQKKVLIDQVILAKELDLPVILHDREAHGDMMDILRQYRPKGVMHCFSGSTELMKETVLLGLYVGLGGAVTFKNARHPLDVARNVPIDRLLIETDCPYMAPVPFRGKRCDSAMLTLVAEKISGIRGVTAQEIIDVTRHNAQTLFQI